MAQGQKFFRKSALLLATLIPMSWLTSWQVAEAFPWWLGYSPLSGSTSRMWVSRTLFNPTNVLRSGYGGYSAPYYLANTLAWNTAYAASQGLSYGKRRAVPSQSWNPGGVVDQIAPANWANQQALPLPPAVISVPGAAPSAFTAPDLTANMPAILAPSADPFFMPIPATMDAPASSTGSLNPASNSIAALPTVTPTAVSSELPSTAPSFAPTNGVAPTASKLGSNSSNQKGEANPFAQAFVEHVNKRFGGDINKAFADKQTRGYAHALGLLDNREKAAELPEDRVALIKRIMHDPGEDSLTKVNTIRLLIKH